MELNKTKILTFIFIGLIFEAGLIFFISDYKKNHPEGENPPRNCGFMPCYPNCYDCNPTPPIPPTPEHDQPVSNRYFFTNPNSSYSGFSVESISDKKLVANLILDSGGRVEDRSSSMNKVYFKGLKKDRPNYDKSDKFYGGQSNTEEPPSSFMDFSNIGDRLEMNNPKNLSFGLKDNISISTWIRPHTAKIYNEIIAKDRVNTSSTNYALRIGNGVGQERILVFYYLNTHGSWEVYQSKENVVPLDKWSHIAVTYQFGKSESISLYLNGKKVDGSWAFGNGDDEPQVSEQSPLWVGSILDGEYWSFDGLIGNIQIYRDILSEKDINTLFKASNPPSGEYKNN